MPESLETRPERPPGPTQSGCKTCLEASPNVSQEGPNTAYCALVGVFVQQEERCWELLAQPKMWARKARCFISTCAVINIAGPLSFKVTVYVSWNSSQPVGMAGDMRLNPPPPSELVFGFGVAFSANATLYGSLLGWWAPRQRTDVSSLLEA